MLKYKKIQTIFFEGDLVEQLIELESLAAKKDISNDDEFYLTALDQAINNKDNKNIAITGGYGAGKTTLIESFFNINSKKFKAEEMMRVSIATFEPTKGGEGGNSNKEQNLLEQQIVQQIFYQINPDKIPNSRFTKISDLSFWYVLRLIIFLFLTVFLTYFTIDKGWLSQLYTYLTSYYNSFIGVMGAALPALILLILNGTTLYILILLIRKLGISKFGFASTKIEFDSERDSRVFNYYLDEIIYLFKKSRYKYIVFEDLDRFQSVKIFERLRGLNTILNSTSQLKNKDIKFIYALKDDVFVHSDNKDSIHNRTKFFDFIIPTVKIMHSSNAESELSKRLKPLIAYDMGKVGKDKLNKELIEDISLYINDMRTLINICNEFEIFRFRLTKSSITYNHLLSFIVYKNLYPEDYSNLLENRGIVYNIFNRKEGIIKNIQEEISLLRNFESHGLGRIITHKDELGMLFIRKRNLISKQIRFTNKHESITINGSSQRDTNILFGFLKKHDQDDGKVVVSKDPNNITEFSNINEFMTIEGINFLKLYNDFDNDHLKAEESIEDQIESLDKKINNVQSKSISRLINEDNIELSLDLRKNELLYFLIKNDWLNESYEDYLTVFREGKITIKDSEFLKKVKAGTNDVHLYYNLNNPYEVANKIRYEDLSSVSAINLDLIIVLLEKGSKSNNEKLSKIIEVLFSNLSVLYDDYIGLLKGLETTLVNKFFGKVIEQGFNIWECIGKDDNLSKEQKDSYAILILSFLNQDLLEEMDNSHFQEYLSNEIDVKELPDNDILYVNIEKLQVKLNSLVGMKVSVVKEISSISAYEINLTNLSVIFGVDVILKETIDKDENIKNYCMSNLENFINYVLLQQPVYQESEEIFLDFLNILYDNEVNETLISSLINKWDGVVSNLRNVNLTSIINNLYEVNKFSLDWPNISYCKEVLENNDLEFEIINLLSHKKQWKELINNTTNEIQKEFIENDKYNRTVVNILNANRREINLEYENFINKLIEPIYLEDYKELSQYTINLLIEQKLLAWNISVFYNLESESLKKKYASGTIPGIDEDDLQELIAEEELYWSYDLFQYMIGLDDFDPDLLHNYISYNIFDINKKELTLIHKEGHLSFNEKTLESLLQDLSMFDKFIHMMLLLRSSHVDQTINFVKAHIIPWDKKLFDSIREDDIETATKYLLDHPNEIYNVKIDQELFERLVELSEDDYLIIDLIEKNIDKLSITSKIAHRALEISEDEKEYVFNKLSQTSLVLVISALSLDGSAKMIRYYIEFKYLGTVEVYTFLEKCPSPYNRIKPNGKHLKIESNHSNVVTLLSYLKSIKVVSSYKPKDDSYNVINKQKVFNTRL
ncbi:hypothetical protein [Sediminibacillus albus]|uniref:YobI-like P-loop NTPase domain-containing protein n=1 Tax=Sediminibacillus albus TaxID=407036 RepID=A0A1G9C429_9BACI|nr:hypothetical protein [Sediminibacillus albus]SDK46442.1 hypothetical protein SAMN05216243_3235 [Sediminibacillus albus]